MGTIHTPDETTFQVVRSEKTSFPKLIYLPGGLSEEDIDAGEFVGRNESNPARRELEKITATNYEAQAKHALMRINTTSNDVRESGGVTVRKGHFEAKTKHYLEGETYNVGDLLTLRYSSDRDGGVLGPTEASTEYIVGKVEQAPQNTAAGNQDMLEATLFENPVPTSNVSL